MTATLTLTRRTELATDVSERPHRSIDGVLEYIAGRAGGRTLELLQLGHGAGLLGIGACLALTASILSYVVF